MTQNALYYLRTGFLILFIITLFGYTFFQARTIIFGPKITITSPLDGVTYDHSLIEVKGIATNVTHLLLNDRPMFSDIHGAFDEKLLLLPGYTIIKVDAEDKFGTKTEKIISVILKESGAMMISTTTQSKIVPQHTASSTASTTNQNSN